MAIWAPALLMNCSSPGLILKNAMFVVDAPEVEGIYERGVILTIDADLQVPDTTKFRTHTGWRPEFPFETTMRDLLEYWRERVRRNESFLSR